MPEEEEYTLPPFKSQPWVVYDTVAARSYLLGENDSDFFAFGTPDPAISVQGEMFFFTAGRKHSKEPWYTSLSLVGQLSYGFVAWQIYLYVAMPIWPSAANNDGFSSGSVQEVAGTTMLAHSIINFGVLQMKLGQEQQTSWKCHRFGTGGGFHIGTPAGIQNPLNGRPNWDNVLALPEPIEIARTQNLDAKIRLAPEVFDLIGSPAAPGVGVRLNDYLLILNGPNGLEETAVQPVPFITQLGFRGRRIKKTQYGQLPEWAFSWDYAQKSRVELHGQSGVEIEASGNRLLDSHRLGRSDLRHIARRRQGHRSRV